MNTLLRRIYGADRVNVHDYATVLSSLAFAGTIVGMLTFGYLSDKLGRKFGMVRALVLMSPYMQLNEYMRLDARDGHRRPVLRPLRCVQRRSRKSSWDAHNVERMPVRQ